MIKVLQINVEVGRNSTGRIVEQIGNLAIQNNMESYIAFSRGEQDSNSKLIRIGNFATILFHVLWTRLMGKDLNGSTITTKRLIKNIIKINPDIIHLHQVHGYYLNTEILFSFLSTYNKPVVWTLHDCWAFTGHCSYFSLVNCDKWKTQCSQCPQSKKYPASWFFDHSRSNYYTKKKLFNQVKNITFVSVSEWLGKLAKQSFISENKIITIPNGADLSIFKYRNDYQGFKQKLKIEDKFILLGVGTTWNKSKGLDDFLNLSKVIPNDMVIVLVGLSSEQLPSQYTKVIQVDKTNNVEDLVRLYSMADVLLSLSYQESFGLTPIEAMACGTPAIVYNATALPELVNEEVGFIVEPGDIGAVVKSVERIRLNGRKYYSSNCRKRVEKFYNKNDNFFKYIKLYKEVLTK